MDKATVEVVGPVDSSKYVSYVKIEVPGKASYMYLVRNCDISPEYLEELRKEGEVNMHKVLQFIEERDAEKPEKTVVKEPKLKKFATA